jgi:hypothetical protein
MAANARAQFPGGIFKLMTSWGNAPMCWVIMLKNNDTSVE